MGVAEYYVANASTPRSLLITLGWNLLRCLHSSPRSRRRRVLNSKGCKYLSHITSDQKDDGDQADMLYRAILGAWDDSTLHF